MSLAALKANVDAEAALHLPDLIYNVESPEHDIKFDMFPLSTMLSPTDSDIVGLEIRRNEERLPYVFSKWSRSQLLSLLGAREKWFHSVTLHRQAEELNARRNVLNTYKLRTMRAQDEDFPLRFIRGLVSSDYSDIMNTDIMNAIIDKAPASAMALVGPSGISDRAFYVYAVVPSPITIPGTRFLAYPAAVVKNSEVGYTSLYVIPGLLMVYEEQRMPVVFESRAVLKKIHRGKIDLLDSFDAAFTACSKIWADTETKIPSLFAYSYGTEDGAIDSMKKLLFSSFASKDLVDRCVTAYKRQTRLHTALDIVETITEVCASADDRDEQYTFGAIAGAVLYKLMF